MNHAFELISRTDRIWQAIRQQLYIKDVLVISIFSHILSHFTFNN